MGDGDGLGMRARGPEESALLPLSSDLWLLSPIRSLDPERALTVTDPGLLSRDRERKISSSTRELARADAGVTRLQTHNEDSR